MFRTPRKTHSLKTNSESAVCGEKEIQILQRKGYKGIETELKSREMDSSDGVGQTSHRASP